MVTWVGRRSPRELIGGAAAILAPTIMWTEFLVFGLRTPGYSIVTRAASDLAARDAPNADVFVIGFFYLAGALTVLLGASLAMAPRARRTWRLGAGLVVLEGVLLGLTGAFPEDLAAGGGSPHPFLATGCFAAAALAPAVLAAGAAPAAAPAMLRRLWLACGGALLPLLVGATVLRTMVRFPDGLFQRPFGLLLTAWFVGTGLWLLHGTASEARSGQTGRSAAGAGGGAQPRPDRGSPRNA